MKNILKNKMMPILLVIIIAFTAFTPIAAATVPTHKYNYAITGNSDAEMVEFYFNFYENKSFYNEIASVEKAVDAAYKEMNLGSKDLFHKLLTIYQWIGSNVHYKSNSENDYSKHSTFYWTLIEHKGACGDFAILFRFLCVNAGITDVEYIDGYNGAAGAHAWNIVKFNNLWYIIDASDGAHSFLFGFLTTYTETPYTRNSNYTTSAFTKAHPMATTAIDVSAPPYNISGIRNKTTDFNLQVKQTCGSDKVTLSWTVPNNIKTFQIYEKHGKQAGVLGSVLNDDGMIYTTGNYPSDYFSPSDAKSVTLTISEDTEFYILGTGEYYTKYISDTLGSYISYKTKQHKWTITSKQESTCTQSGYENKVCDNCGKTQSTSTVANGHVKGTFIKTVAPTCTVTGYSEYYCSICGQVFQTDTKSALGHSMGELVEHKDAACTTQGYDIYTCSKCEESYKTNVRAATGHNYTTVVSKKATTSANGSYYKKCTKCGAKTSSTTIKKISSVALSTTVYTYNGNIKKPSVTVKNSAGTKLKNGTDYTVTYTSGRKNVGKYTVTVKFKGNYSGIVKKTFTIKPKATSVSKLTAGKKKFTVKWKKLTTQTTGYQIQYATNSKFTQNKKTITVKKNSTTSKTVSKLKAKKKYYVRVRTYKTVKVNGKSTKIYSSWSKAKVVTTKK